MVSFFTERDKNIDNNSIFSVQAAIIRFSTFVLLFCFIEHICPLNRGLNSNNFIIVECKGHYIYVIVIVNDMNTLATNCTCCYIPQSWQW